MVERPAGKTLQKSAAVEETSSPVETEGQRPSATYWEELQDIYFKRRFQRARNASQESFLDDEDECKINLTKMYHEDSTEGTALVLLTPDATESIDDLIKSLEKDAVEEESESVTEETAAILLD